MLKYIFGTQGQVFRNAILSNRSVQEFYTPKLLLTGLTTWLSVTGQAPKLLLLTVLLVFFLEIVLALYEMRRGVREGFTVHRSRRNAAIRAGFASIFCLAVLILFSFIYFWIAFPLALVIYVASMAIYFRINMTLVFKDMRGNPPSELSVLYQQVREMRELDSTAIELRKHLVVAGGLDKRRDLKFFLGWAETYRGHRLLPMEQWENAASYYQKALEIDPSNQSARTCLAVCYARMGDFELSLNHVTRAIAVYNGNSKRIKPRYDQGIWHWHRNEVSSVYEQNAGLFQLCSLVLALLKISDESGAVKELIELEIGTLICQLPGHNKDDINVLLNKKGGTSPGALVVLCAGPYRTPASPLDLLESALTLPLLSIQIVEPAA